MTVAVEGQRPQLGEPLTLGIRPENLQPASEGRNTLPVVLRHAERTGDATVLYISLRGSSELLTCRVPGSFTSAPQTSLFLRVDEAAFHVFDQEGDSLPRRGLAHSRQMN